MKLKLIGLLVFTNMGLYAADTPLKSTVSAVTVYLEGAQVTRTASINL